MATKVSSIYVVGLKTSSRWVDRCVVELYDSAALTNRVGLRTSEVVWDGTHNVQKSIIIFDGLVTGNQYWVKAGFSTPVTGVITYQTALAVTANDTTAPACGYSGTYTSTTSGVSFEVTPSSVPSDLDHFEACWTVNDATAPTSTTVPDIARLAVISSKFQFLAGGKSGDVIRAYVRAVDTSGNAQAWQLLGGTTYTVSTGLTAGGSIDLLTDGSNGYIPKYDATNPLIADFLYNGSFEVFPTTQTLADGWTPNYDPNNTATYSRSTSSQVGNVAQAITNGAGGGSIASRPITVVGGAQYTLGVQAKSTSASPGTLYIRVLWFANSNDFTWAGTLSWSDIVAAGGPSVANTYQLFTGAVTAPATAKYARVLLYNWTGTNNTMTFDAVTFTLSTPVGNVNPDGTYNTPNYHKSAVRMKQTSTVGSTTVGSDPAGSGVWTTAGSYILIFPSVVGGYKATVTLKKNSAGGSYYNANARLVVGANVSTGTLTRNDDGFNFGSFTATAELTVSASLSGAQSVQVQYFIESDYGGNWTVQVSQAYYLDQDPDNIL